MASWLIKNKVKNAKDIISFSDHGYNYSPEESKDSLPIFIRG